MKAQAICVFCGIKISQIWCDLLQESFKLLYDEICKIKLKLLFSAIWSEIIFITTLTQSQIQKNIY